MSRWLDHLEALGVLEEAPQEPPLPTLFRTEPPATPEADQAPAEAACEALEERIRYARSEAELEVALAQIQAGFEAGQLTQAQAERLAHLSTEVARQLEHGLCNVPTEALLGSAGDGDA